MKNQVAVFIASSDNTHDVLERVYPSVMRNWAGIPVSKFVGLNERKFSEPGIDVVRAPVAGWRSELIHQLCQLQFDRIILLLDDFLFFKKVNVSRLMELVGEAQRSDLAYLRLVPPDGAFLFRLGRSLRRGGVQPIPAAQPYYSSLQAALWKRDYLISCLAKSGSIWEFEHQIDPAVQHFAVKDPILIYKHVVEKGRWLPEAPMLFERAGLAFSPGGRGEWTQQSLAGRRLARLRFEVMGYAGMRLRRRLARRRDRTSQC